jgi:hypothetical protein
MFSEPIVTLLDHIGCWLLVVLLDAPLVAGTIVLKIRVIAIVSDVISGMRLHIWVYEVVGWLSVSCGRSNKKNAVVIMDDRGECLVCE